MRAIDGLAAESGAGKRVRQEASHDVAGADAHEPKSESFTIAVEW